MGDVALQTAHDLLVGVAFSSAAGDVGLGGGAAAHPGNGDGVDGPVESAIRTAVEPVTDGPAAAGLTGLVPASAANTASSRHRPAWEKDTMAWVAVTGSVPRRSVSPGVRSLTMACGCARLVASAGAIAESESEAADLGVPRVLAIGIAGLATGARAVRAASVSRPRASRRSTSSPPSSSARSRLVYTVVTVVSAPRWVSAISVHESVHETAVRPCLWCPIRRLLSRGCARSPDMWASASRLRIRRSLRRLGGDPSPVAQLWAGYRAPLS